MVARRGIAQARLLAALLAVVVVGTVVMGTCALLLTTAQDQARQAQLRQSPAEELAVEVVLSRVPRDAVRAVDAVTGVLTGAVAPLPVTFTTWTTSMVRDLQAGPDGEDRLGYLAGISDLPERAELVAGRWPAPPGGTGPWEAVLPTRAAELLELGPGDQVQLGLSGGARTPGLAVVLVGTFAVDAGDPAWEPDLLGGAGYTPRLEVSGWQGTSRSAYGPFVVVADALLGWNGQAGAAGALDQVRVVAHPDVVQASADDLAAVRAGLTDARTALPVALAGQDAVARVDAPLAVTFAGLDSQQAVTGSGVLVVAFVGFALAGTALGLTARLVTGRRRAEAALLTARGAGRRRLVGQAAAEALVLAVVATALAVPLSLLLYRGLTRLPRLADAGLAGPVAVTGPLVGTVVAGAALLTAVLVVPALAPVGGGAAVRRGRRGAVIRSGVDLLLAAVAVLGFLQMRAHPGTAGDGVDPVLVAAPVLSLLAGAVLALRVLPVLQAAAERAARRSRGLVVSLAAWEVARRQHTTGAVFLLVLATAAATFGTGYASTWGTSQAEQAAARVGTDLTVPATPGPPSSQGDVVAGATGGTVSPATVRPVSLGSFSLPGRLPTTRLVAVDTMAAAELLRGRPSDSTTWAEVTAELGPDEPGDGALFTVPDTGSAVTVTGSSLAGVLGVRPVLVVQDAQGGRSTLTGEVVALDGLAHPVGLRDTTDAVPVAGTRFTVVGMDLELLLLDRAGIDPAVERRTDVTVQVELVGEPAGPRGNGWMARGPVDGPPLLLQRTAASLAVTGASSALTASATVSLQGLLVDDAHLLVTGYLPPAAVPVLLSQDLADALGAEVDERVALGVGGQSLTGLVVGVVPYVPAAPGRPGVLADHEMLSRAVAATGDLESLVDSWWVGSVDDPSAAASRLTDTGLPGAVTRAEVATQLREGPLRVGLSAALWLLTAAAAGLALTGTAVHTAASLEARAVEVARLQGLGAPRRAVAASVLVEHALVTTVAVLLGAGVGALASRFLAPLMTVSETGAVPVPAPVAQWPWPAESLVVGGLLAGCVAVVVPVAGSLLRRAGAVHLRLGEPL